MKPTVLQVKSPAITATKDSHKQAYPENRTPITQVQKAIRELLATSYGAHGSQHTLSDIIASYATITLQ